MKQMKLDESEIEYSKNNLKAFKTHLMLQLLHYTRLGYTIFCSFCCTIHLRSTQCFLENFQNSFCV